MRLRGVAAMPALGMALAMVACASGPPPSTRPAAAAQKEPAVARLYDVRAGFWVHLHQQLYAESSRRPPPDPVRPAAASEQEAWDGALAVYRQRYPQRGFMTLLENPELTATNRRLSDTANDANLAAASELSAELRAALEAAAPVYRRHRWAEDERAARAFHERLTPLLARHGESIAKTLARIYETPWPSSPIRLDIAPFAGPTGAYTMAGPPPHITLASRDSRNQGDAALELVFHEASHALIERVEQSIERAAKAQNKRLPRGIWHAVLFYATGDAVKRELGPGYTPYANANGVYARDPGWAAAEPLLARHWPAYVEGKLSLDATIDQIVAGLPERG